MATYTRMKLIQRILFRLGVQDPNEDVAPEDYELVNEAAQQKLEELYRKGYIPFDIGTEDSPGVIPARYFNALVGILAVNHIDDFSAFDRTQTLASGQQAGMQTLREFVEEAQLESPTQANYY